MAAESHRSLFEDPYRYAKGVQNELRAWHSRDHMLRHHMTWKVKPLHDPKFS